MSSLILTMKLDGDAAKLVAAIELLKQFAADLGVGVELTVTGQLEVNETFSTGPAVSLETDIRDFLPGDGYERARNCLLRGRIETVGGLVLRTEEDLLAITNFGQRSLDQVKAKLNQVGLELATR